MPKKLLTSNVLLIFCLCTGSAGVAAPAKKGAVAQVPWKDMKHQQRMRYMKEHVTPKMKALFQEFDADMFAELDCATCHGKDAKKRKFKMPSPDLPPLPGTPEAFQAKLKEEASWPKWTKFMFEKVTPEMATLLGTHAFDPKQPEAAGFSCSGCHKLEKVEKVEKP